MIMLRLVFSGLNLKKGIECHPGRVNGFPDVLKRLHGVYVHIHVAFYDCEAFLMRTRSVLAAIDHDTIKRWLIMVNKHMSSFSCHHLGPIHWHITYANLYSMPTGLQTVAYGSSSWGEPTQSYAVVEVVPTGNAAKCISELAGVCWSVTLVLESTYWQWQPLKSVPYLFVVSGAVLDQR